MDEQRSTYQSKIKWGSCDLAFFFKNVNTENRFKIYFLENMTTVRDSFDICNGLYFGDQKLRNNSFYGVYLKKFCGLYK